MKSHKCKGITVPEFNSKLKFILSITFVQTLFKFNETRKFAFTPKAGYFDQR